MPLVHSFLKPERNYLHFKKNYYFTHTKNLRELSYLIWQLNCYNNTPKTFAK